MSFCDALLLSGKNVIVDLGGASPTTVPSRDKQRNAIAKSSTPTSTSPHEARSSHREAGHVHFNTLHLSRAHSWVILGNTHTVLPDMDFLTDIRNCNEAIPF